jgi:hypothetical protein
MRWWWSLFCTRPTRLVGFLFYMIYLSFISFNIQIILWKWKVFIFLKITHLYVDQREVICLQYTEKWSDNFIDGQLNLLISTYWYGTDHKCVLLQVLKSSLSNWPSLTCWLCSVIFMKSVMEIALPVKKLSSKNWSNLSGVWRFSVTNFKLPSLHFFENHQHVHFCILLKNVNRNAGFCFALLITCLWSQIWWSHIDSRTRYNSLPVPIYRSVNFYLLKFFVRFNLVLQFQRRRFKCESLRRTTDAKWWQKLTWPLARWAKNLTQSNQ